MAENARFAEIAADHGLTFIGPKPAVINAMGDKATAKRLMREAGVPTTPGSDIVASVDEARAVSRADRLPGAAQGDGRRRRQGHARRRARRASSATAFATAQAEAEASFKDGRMYVEKLIVHPRHIEVQVLADEHGDVVHLGERDCSVQKPRIKN